MRTSIHYATAALLLSVYGGQVCPFLESLTPVQLVAPILAALGIQFLAQHLAGQRWISKSDYKYQAKRTFALQFGLFLTSGFALAVFNRFIHGFPMGSGLKLVVGLALLGFFAAIDLSLEKEKELVLFFRASGKQMEPDERFFPLTRKLSLFASACTCFLLLVFFLLLAKDLDWLHDVGTTVTVPQARRAILIEILFVTAVVFSHVLNLIFSYTRNLNLFFSNENKVLSRATGGDLQGWVPVGSNDEFGVMAKHTNLMVEGLRMRTEELQRTRDVTILSLATLAETRDNETGAHLLRTQRYVRALAEHLKEHPKYRDLLRAETIDLLFKSAPLHDIGKVGIPDAILLKPGKLTEEEFTIMKKHPGLGRDALRVAEKELGSNSFLEIAREIAFTHHEKWDGSGYPNGLQGEKIPLSGRLMAVADVYDALVSARVYKPAFPHDKAMAIIKEGSGSHFDPMVIEALVAREQEIIEIARRYRDQAAAAV